MNLYPFEETLKRGAEYAEMIENIDIGGPAMIRSGAKNHGFVNVIVDVEDYDVVLAELEANDGQTSYALRQRLAQTAYARTAAYDTAVSTWMASQIGETPRRRTVGGTLAQTLRYGENPHQAAAFIPMVLCAQALRLRSSTKVKNCLTIISMTQMRHLNWSANLIQAKVRLSLSSSTRTRAALHVVIHWLKHIHAHSIAIAPARLAGLLRLINRLMVQQQKKSARFSLRW